MEPQEEEGSSLPALVLCGLEGQRKGSSSSSRREAGPQRKRRVALGSAAGNMVCFSPESAVPSPLCPAHSFKDKDLFLSMVTAYSPSELQNASFRKPSLVSVTDTALLLQARTTMEMPHSWD